MGGNGIGHGAAMAAGSKDQPRQGHSATGCNSKGNSDPLIQPDTDQQLKGSKRQHPRQTTRQKSHGEHSCCSDIETGDAGMGPASLVQALEQMEAMGLEHLLPINQSARQAQKGITQ
jgi:hypothetical protein